MTRNAVWLLWLLFGALPPEALCQSPTSYLNLPLSFEANRGQAPAGVRYLARGAGYSLQLSAKGAVLSLSGEKHPLQMQLVGADSKASILGRNALPGKSNYLLGKDASHWITGVPHYAQVEYRQVYPGVDLVFYGDVGRLEYDFIVDPGADPNQILLSFAGSASKKIETLTGDLILGIGQSQIRNIKPRVYQYMGGQRRQIPGRYVLAGSGQVRFALGDYDRREKLVIDPVILYATTLGNTATNEPC